MSLFSSAFRRLFGCFTPFFRQRETQQCAVEELVAVEKAPESETLNFTANCKKSSMVKPLQTSAQLTVLKPLPDDCADFSLPTTSFQPLAPLKRSPVHLVEEPQCESDELFSCRLYPGCPLSPITVEEPQHEFFLPGCPLPVPRPRVLAVRRRRPVAAHKLSSSVCSLSTISEEESQYASDELYSCQLSSVCPLSSITMEEPQHEFVLPGCPLPVPHPRVRAVPPRPVSAPDELFSFRLSSVRPLSPTAEEEPQNEFVLPGCPLPLPPPKVRAVHYPRPVSAPDELFSFPLSSVRPLSPTAEEEPQHEFVLPGCPLQVHPFKVLAVSYSCLKEHLPASSVKSASTSEEEYEDDSLENDSVMSELIELQDLHESGDSLLCTMAFGGAESQLKVTVQNETKSPVQLSWGDKVKDWVKRKLQKKEKMRKAHVN